MFDYTYRGKPQVMKKQCLTWIMQAMHTLKLRTGVGLKNDAQGNLTVSEEVERMEFLINFTFLSLYFLAILSSIKSNVNVPNLGTLTYTIPKRKAGRIAD